MSPAPVAIGRLFQRLAIDLQPLAGARGIDLRFVMTSQAVLSDPVLLRQIAPACTCEFNDIPDKVVQIDRDHLFVDLRFAIEFS